ncbi:Shedu immune nuclease family protein [Methylorubrum extorquens]|uniref:Shedu protein SduA C-terminal domain-containing protein n=1 Tax=Methylorubrum extorquens (strain CM4 / NCIMB 13688) TaxID=440085 RepID=B7L321_METC4|nr:Shedu immune nuclease family protein [Methylorubrum extorquens]ACK86229.1 conserved hypothetical protein [Methylorubrum extorquens CM4]
MALNPYRAGRGMTPNYGDVIIKTGKICTLSFQPNQDGLDAALRNDPTFVAPPKPILIARIDDAAGTLEIYPLNTTRESGDLFGPKYDRIESIRFENFNLSLWHPTDLDEARHYLAKLPAGFVRAPEMGFGIDYELRAITEALEEMSIDGLVIRAGRTSGLPRLEGTKYVMSKVHFDTVRRAVRRVHDQALARAGEEKERVAHNELLTRVDPAQFPEQPPIYRPDGVTAIIATRSGDDLSPRDQQTVIAAAGAVAKAATKRNQAPLLQLSRKIETVTLDELISRFRNLLNDKSSENKWQTFFRDNPFVLRLAFGFPVVQMGEQVSVGGGKFTGTGGKISDFVVKAAATGNLALIEIKTADTPLLEKLEYRGGVHAPHRELSGAVNQVLDQRYLLQKHLPALKENSGDYDVEGFSVQGLVIAGRAPEIRDQKKSFEIFRHSLKSIVIITFDELLKKLEMLSDFLRSSDVPEMTASDAAEKDDCADGTHMQ